MRAAASTQMLGHIIHKSLLIYYGQIHRTEWRKILGNCTQFGPFLKILVFLPLHIMNNFNDPICVSPETYLVGRKPIEKPPVLYRATNSKWASLANLMASLWKEITTLHWRHFALLCNKTNSITSSDSLHTCNSNKTFFLTILVDQLCTLHRSDTCRNLGLA